MKYRGLGSARVEAIDLDEHAVTARRFVMEPDQHVLEILDVVTRADSVVLETPIER